MAESPQQLVSSVLTRGFALELEDKITMESTIGHIICTVSCGLHTTSRWTGRMLKKAKSFSNNIQVCIWHVYIYTLN